jgi:hypothetical protein
MDLDKARRALSKRGTLSSKRVAFFVVAGLCLAAGILLRSGQYFDQQKVEQNPPVAVAAPPPPAAATSAIAQTPSPAVATSAVPETPPPAQETSTPPNAQAEQIGAAVEQVGETAEHAEQPQFQGSGMILVARQPVAVLASPSSSAPALYGFPAGRPFRVIGRDGGFAHIQDLRSSASGWIDEAALALPPRIPAVSAPSQPRPSAVSRKPANPSADAKPKASKKDSRNTADSEAATQGNLVQTRKRPGFFGRGGVFGGIFRNGN